MLGISPEHRDFWSELVIAWFRNAARRLEIAHELDEDAPLSRAGADHHRCRHDRKAKADRTEVTTLVTLRNGAQTSPTGQGAEQIAIPTFRMPFFTHHLHWQMPGVDHLRRFD